MKKIDLKQIVRSLLQWLDQSSTELRVWQEFDQGGECSWSAYDPATRRSIYHLSESEMRIWIEQRGQH